MGIHNISFMPTEAVVVHLLNALHRELFPVPVNRDISEHIIYLLILWNRREGYHSFEPTYGKRLKFYIEKLSGYISLPVSSILFVAKMNARTSDVPLFLQTIFASVSPSVSETITFAEKLYKLFDISFSQNSKKAVVSSTQFEDPKLARRPSFTTYLMTTRSVLEDKTTLLHKVGEALDILYFKFDVSVLADYQKEKDKRAEMITDIIHSEVRPYVDNVFEQFNLNGSLLTVWLYMRDIIHFNLITDLLISRSVFCQEAINHKSVKTIVSKWLPIYKVMLLSASDKFVANSLIISEV